MLYKARRLRLILGCLMFLSVSTCKCQTAEEIVSKYLDTISFNNSDRWTTVKSFYATSVGYFNDNSMEYRTPERSAKDVSCKKLLNLGPTR